MPKKLAATKETAASSYEREVLAALKELYPRMIILRQVYLAKETRSRVKNTRVDFYMPELNLCIEVDGEHHFKPIEYDEHAQANFENRQAMDRLKDEFLELAGYNVLHVPYTVIDDNLKDWLKEQIKEILKGG